MTTTSPFSRRLFRRFTPLALMLAASADLYAQLPVAVSLQGRSEVPPVTTSASGMGQFTVQPDYTVSGSIKVSGMVATMAHIHEAVTGKNGPPIVTLAKVGSDAFVVPPDTRLTDAQYASYKAGHLYVNVHSAQHPNGEIRSQLLYLEMADVPRLSATPAGDEK